MNEFFPYNKEVEDQLIQIKKLIRLSMNGVTSEAMQQLGYKVNYGVALPQIKKIAGRFSESHILARRLWQTGYRETMIMATLLQPEDSFSRENAIEWISQCNNIELVEQCCRNLLIRLPYANELAATMLLQEDKYRKSTGYILYSLLLMQDRADENILPSFMENAAKDISDNSFVVYSAVARFLKQLGKKDKNMIFDFLSRVSLDEKGAEWVNEEVRFFLENE